MKTLTYTRVIPRDLFNEANLLKCYGQLALHLLDYHYITNPRFEEPEEGESFDIQQDDSTGETFIANLQLIIGNEQCALSRPVNSRNPWPLYLSAGNLDEPISVFDDDGNLSDAMLSLLKGESA